MLCFVALFLLQISEMVALFLQKVQLGWSKRSSGIEHNVPGINNRSAYHREISNGMTALKMNLKRSGW